MNVVFVVLDTARKDKISVYNSDIDFTENIEEFAEDAEVFENAVSQAPWTLPSHASIFTGMYPWEHGATQRKLFLDTDKTLLAEKFKQEGYETACYTSNTWISPYTGMTEGFDNIDNFFGILPNDLISDKAGGIWRLLNTGRGKWFKNKLMKLGEKFHWMSLGDDRKTPRVIDRAELFVEESDEDFFLFLNFMDCHLPYEPPEEYKEKHAPNVDPDKGCQKAHDHNAGRIQVNFEEVEKLYNAEMDYLDDQLGRLFEFFNEADLMDETAFVIVSDHGENLGEGGMFGHQFSVSESLVSVPMIIKSDQLDDDIEKQVEIRELYEIVPWIAGLQDRPEIGADHALGGYEYPDLDLRNIPEEKHDELGKRLRFVRTPSKKLVREGESDFKDKMIDLESMKEIGVEERFRERVEQVGSAESGQMLEDQDEEVKKRLEELGYIDR